MESVYCSKHGIKMISIGGSTYKDTYSSSYVCPICGERKRRTIDLNTDKEKIRLVTPGEDRVHYIKVDREMNIRLAACNDCNKNHYVCMKEKKNGIQAPFCPGHNKFIRSWDRVTWLKLEVPIDTLELKGIFA